MKLVTYERFGAFRTGILLDNDSGSFIVDLNHLNALIPTDMKTFLSMGQDGLDIAREAVNACQPTSWIPLELVTLKAPVPNPGKILCLGLNYRDHAAETNNPLPDFPAIFSKYSNGVIGPMSPIRLPRVSTMVDYEGELAVVIGKKVKNVHESEALKAVAGYTALNDVSARDYQKRSTQWTSGKIFDTFAPMGPALVTGDEIPDPGNLQISLSLNGQLMQNSNTANLIFSVPYLVSYISQILTLEPGDVISTGTPAGVGQVRKPPVFLQQGDLVSITIENIGELVNPVLNEK